MFGLFNGVKYRGDVTVEIYAILKLVPQLKSVLNTFPNLNDTISGLRKEKMPAIEAAAHLSLLVIERLMQPASPDIRMLTLRYLDESADDGFRRFARYYQAVSTNQTPECPAGMPNLAPVLGLAFWYLGVAARENGLSEQCYRMFVGDVIGMLRGKTQDERRRDRLTNMLS